jgi:hypothetical protein
MATIWKRGDLQWQARIRRKGYSDQNKTFETKADAETWSRQVESEMDRGIFVSRAEAKKTTLSECLDRYIEEYIPRLAQVYTETTRARAIQRREISSRIIATIRSKDIADFVKERESEGRSGNTIRLDLALLSRLFNVARADWGMESLSNPVQLISKPKVARGRERRLEEGEEEKLLTAATPIFRPVFLFACETAMRREEIASLEVQGRPGKALALSPRNQKRLCSVRSPLSCCHSSAKRYARPPRWFCFWHDIKRNHPGHGCSQKKG